MRSRFSFLLSDHLFPYLCLLVSLVFSYSNLLFGAFNRYLVSKSFELQVFDKCLLTSILYVRKSLVSQSESQNEAQHLERWTAPVWADVNEDLSIDPNRLCGVGGHLHSAMLFLHILFSLLIPATP